MPKNLTPSQRLRLKIQELYDLKVQAGVIAPQYFTKEAYYEACMKVVINDFAADVDLMYRCMER